MGTQFSFMLQATASEIGSLLCQWASQVTGIVSTSDIMYRNEGFVSQANNIISGKVVVSRTQWEKAPSR